MFTADHSGRLCFFLIQARSEFYIWNRSILHAQNGNSPHVRPPRFVILKVSDERGGAAATRPHTSRRRTASERATPTPPLAHSSNVHMWRISSCRSARLSNSGLPKRKLSRKSSLRWPPSSGLLDWASCIWVLHGLLSASGNRTIHAPLIRSSWACYSSSPPRPSPASSRSPSPAHSPTPPQLQPV